MKKSTLALSVAAAIGSMGFAGAASAMEVQKSGVGHQLIVPYFTTQSDNATLLNITNTDTTNGKAVKVRFRGAANSDDLFDFTLLLSPGDVWTAAVTQGADGISKLTTSDKSCTLPQSVNAAFSTFRLDSSATAAAKANGTREGYVEIINMGNISGSAYAAMSADVKATSLFKAVKHVNGVAPCTLAVLDDKLGTKSAGDAALAAPTGGLAADWIIMNQVNTAAWSGSAVALSPASGTAAITAFWPQKAGNAESVASFTVDPVFTKTIVTAQNFDLPDLSTPYTSGATPTTQADAVTAALAVKSVANSFTTSDDIGAVTDFVFAQPTRRYHVAVNYTATSTSNVATTGSLAKAIYRDTTADAAGGSTTASAYYASANMGFEGTGRTLCLKTISVPGKNALFDREETTPTDAPNEFTISPVVPGSTTTVYFCGETNVVSINNGGTVGDSALSASVTRKDITFANYESGWMEFSTLAADTTKGLPILGGSFMRVNNGAQNYGFMFGHKTTK